MVGHFVDAVVRDVIDLDAFLAGGDQVDIVDAQAEPADRLAFGELHQQLARQLGVGDEDRIGILCDRQNVLRRGAFRHPQLVIDAGQRRFRRIERGKHVVGHSNQEAGHTKLRRLGGAP